MYGARRSETAARAPRAGTGRRRRWPQITTAAAGPRAAAARLPLVLNPGGSASWCRPLARHRRVRACVCVCGRSRPRFVLIPCAARCHSLAATPALVGARWTQLSRTHTHSTHCRTHTHTHTHTYARTHTQSHNGTCLHAHTHTRTRTHTVTHAHTHTHTHRLARSLTHAWRPLAAQRADPASTRAPRNRARGFLALAERAAHPALRGPGRSALPRGRDSRARARESAPSPGNSPRDFPGSAARNPRRGVFSSSLWF